MLGLVDFELVIINVSVMDRIGFDAPFCSSRRPAALRDVLFRPLWPDPETPSKASKRRLDIWKELAVVLQAWLRDKARQIDSFLVRGSLGDQRAIFVVSPKCCGPLSLGILKVLRFFRKMVVACAAHLC